eukprot:TRINITY_DN10523_c0_g2_i4.p1 TRINITY_DN10523_c0_g2~~TRINITY_DN10523_c0_g2_i4.p1  ORF type:complete len:667 (-),score=97.19 TRINITY_DN10523_c0_g2_i4:298-2118(-)
MSEVFPNLSEDEQYRLLQLVLQAIREFPNAKRKLVKATSQVLPEVSIHSLHQILTGQKEQVPSLFQDQVVPQQLLGSFRAGDMLSALVGGVMTLGDRVVHVCEGEDVPFGITGTVVGVYDSMCEVLFDWEFPNGTDLQGRITLHCGGMVPSDYLFNLTAQKQNSVYSPTKPRQLKFNQVISKYPNCLPLARQWVSMSANYMQRQSAFANNLPSVNGHQDLSVLSLLQGLSSNTANNPTLPQHLYNSSPLPPNPNIAHSSNYFEELKILHRLRNDPNFLPDYSVQESNIASLGTRGYSFGDIQDSNVPPLSSRGYSFGDIQQFKKWEPKSEDAKKSMLYFNQKLRIEELLSELQFKQPRGSSDRPSAELLQQLQQLQQFKQASDERQAAEQLKAQLKQLQLKQLYSQQQLQSQQQQQQIQQQQQQQQQQEQQRAIQEQVSQLRLNHKQQQIVPQSSQSKAQSPDLDLRSSVPKKSGQDKPAIISSDRSDQQPDSELDTDAYWEAYWEYCKQGYQKERKQAKIEAGDEIDDAEEDEQENDDNGDTTSNNGDNGNGASSVEDKQMSKIQKLGDEDQKSGNGGVGGVGVGSFRSSQPKGDFLDFWQKLRM